MKTVFVTLTILFASFGSAWNFVAGEIKPAAQIAGRTVKLTEELRITDEEGDFYFKYPRQIRVADDGTIYLLEQKQLLQFNGQGKFQKNFQKIGQGPGEMNWISSICMTGENITALSDNPPKMVLLNSLGIMQKEFSRGLDWSFELIGGANENYYFLQSKTDFQNIKSGPGEKKFKLFYLTATGEIKETGIRYTIPYEAKVERSEKGGTGVMYQFPCHMLTTVSNDSMLYTSANEDYKIEIINLARNKKTGHISKTFSKISFIHPKKERGGIIVNGKKMEPKFADPKYFPDIQQIHFADGRLWVFTSRIEKNKGISVDIFDAAGKHQDSLFLPLPGIEMPHDLTYRPIAIKNNCIYTIEKDEDDTPSLVKYRIKE